MEVEEGRERVAGEGVDLAGLAVRDAGQTGEALVAVYLVHPPHHRARGVPAQLAQRLVDLSQTTDVGLRVPPTEGMSLRAPAVPDAARIQVLPDQARHLRLRLPGHLPQIRPDRALVAPRQRAVTELDQRLDDERVGRKAVTKYEVHRLVARQKAANLL